jgi:hypothetical protein
MLEVISKTAAHEDYHAGELDKAQKVAAVVVVAGEDPAKSLQPGNQPLNLPTPAVAAQRAAVLSEAVAIGPLRGSQLDAIFEQRPVQPITVP